MNWVFVLVALGLAGIIVEMLLSYLGDANGIRDERTQKEQLIQAHQHAIEQAKTETEETSSRLSDLEVTSSSPLKNEKKSIASPYGPCLALV